MYIMCIYIHINDVGNCLGLHITCVKSSKSLKAYSMWPEHQTKKRARVPRLLFEKSRPLLWSQNDHRLLLVLLTCFVAKGSQAKGIRTENGRLEPSAGDVGGNAAVMLHGLCCGPLAAPYLRGPGSGGGA